jgi:hypothetical protein
MVSLVDWDTTAMHADFASAETAVQQRPYIIYTGAGVRSS